VSFQEQLWLKDTMYTASYWLDHPKLQVEFSQLHFEQDQHCWHMYSSQSRKRQLSG